jgi:N-alpha-acetyltransferase 50
VELHVHVTNKDAIRFYQKHGFQEQKVEKNYYKDLTPGDAVLLTLKI